MLGMSALGDILDLQMSPSISDGEGRNEMRLIFEEEGGRGWG